MAVGETNSSLQEGTDQIQILVFSIIITWSIGLFPPLVIRYVILKRPIAKWPAFGTCALFWLINILLFITMGSQSKRHGALVLISFVSFWILRQGTATKVINVSAQTSGSSVSLMVDTTVSSNPTNTDQHTVKGTLLSSLGKEANYASFDGRSVVAVDEDRIYASIAMELETGETDKGLWTRLFAECSGDEKQIKVLYIKQRAERLISAKRISAEKVAAEKVERVVAENAAAEKVVAESTAAEITEVKRVAAVKELQAAEQDLGPNHPKVAAYLNNLALLYKTQGDYSQAESFSKRSQAIRENTAEEFEKRTERLISSERIAVDKASAEYVAIATSEAENVETQQRKNEVRLIENQKRYLQKKVEYRKNESPSPKTDNINRDKIKQSVPEYDWFSEELNRIKLRSFSRIEDICSLKSDDLTKK